MMGSPRKIITRVIVFLLLGTALQYGPMYLEVSGIGKSEHWYEDTFYLFLDTSIHVDRPTGRITHVDVKAGTPFVCLIGREPGGIAILWHQAIANAIVWASMLAVGVYGFQYLKRKTRRFAGLCPECAYPVGGSDVCTECGRPLIKQKAEIA